MLGIFVMYPRCRTPYPVEWLSDNGSASIAKDTLDTATGRWALPLCFTPYRSPRIKTAMPKHSSKPSNVICLGCRSCRMPASVIAPLPAWFEYNESSHALRLKFLSPRRVSPSQCSMQPSYPVRSTGCITNRRGVIEHEVIRVRSMLIKNRHPLLYVENDRVEKCEITCIAVFLSLVIAYGGIFKRWSSVMQFTGM